LRIAVVHLARRQNPPEAFQKFWTSYSEHAPGADHDVILVWKNFIGEDHPNIPGVERLRHLVLSDKGCDIDVYFRVAEKFDRYDAFVFLNSWTAIKKDGWLGIMRDTLRGKVGLVGAFSTPESHRTNLTEGFRTAWQRPGLWKKVTSCLYFAYIWPRLGNRIPSYPNVHVRTNGFMIRREVLLQVRKPVIFDKLDALVFESGHRSLTRQVRRNGHEISTLDEQRLMGDNRVK
jgi:hypothetical protein